MQPVELTRQEFDLLALLASQPGHRLQPRRAAGEGLERRHLRHRTDRRQRGQPAAQEGGSRSGRSGVDSHGLGRRLQVRRRRLKRQRDGEGGLARHAAARRWCRRAARRSPWRWTAQAAAARSVGARFVHLVEPLEHVREVLRRDAAARVGHRQAHRVVDRPLARISTVPPAGVWRSALATRLSITCSIRSGSPTI